MILLRVLSLSARADVLYLPAQLTLCSDSGARFPLSQLFVVALGGSSLLENPNRRNTASPVVRSTGVVATQSNHYLYVCLHTAYYCCSRQIDPRPVRDGLGTQDARNARCLASSLHAGTLNSRRIPLRQSPVLPESGKKRHFADPNLRHGTIVSDRRRDAQDVALLPIVHRRP